MKFLIVLLSMSSLSLTSMALAADMDAGREKSLLCVSCHGAEGISEHLNWPNFAGQNAGYIAKQLRDFRAGRRSDPWMSPMALPLSDDEIDDLAAYFAAQKQPLNAGISTDNAKEKTCVACHGQNGMIDNDIWPNLAGQKKQYLIDQMNKYRSGERSDPLMTPIASTLTDRDVEELAEFYSAL